MQITAELKRGLFYSILIAGFLSAPVAAQGRGPQENEVKAVDFGSVRREIQNFEVEINRVINATFTSPFALNQKVKGAYLPGYGVSFDFLVNIHRALINTPFGEIKRDEISPEQKKRRIEDLKKKLVQTLMEKGKAFTQLRKDELITIVAFFEDRNFPEEPSENKTIVLSIFKRDMDDFARRDPKEFEQKVKIFEY